MKKTNNPLTFPCGKSMKNRFMLAPLTNEQSNADGNLSDAEFNWLTMRAIGGFGLTMTCASHVQKMGQGFPGQLGIFSDDLKEGHVKLANEIKANGSLAVIQLHHAGMRAPKELIGSEPICPSDKEKTGARAMTSDEILQLKKDFITAAKRAQEWGYDGVEVHGAHGYILSQFLSAEINKRNDSYGGSLENRSRLLFEIVAAIRKTCGANFLIGVRLSPERFGMDLLEVKKVSQQLINSGNIDFLDISLWDSFKLPENQKYASESLLSHFTSLEKKNVLLTVAGKIRTAKDVEAILSQGVDFVTIGRAAILHHDFPNRVIADPNFKPIETPVSTAYLKAEGLSETFINYMRKWPDFVESNK